MQCFCLHPYGNDGPSVLTDCIFPSLQNNGLDLFAEGGQVIVNLLDVYQINSAKFQVAK
jgi:sucrose-6-phosphate hydrolase SacC (GH32 family)